MDTSFVTKLLDEDEVETMHSGEAVEAFTAALNRDIGLDTAPSTTSQTPNPPGTLGALATDSNSTSNRLVGEWQASGQEDHAIHHSLQQKEQKDLPAQDQHSCQAEQTRHPQSVQHQHQQISSQIEHENLIVQQENLIDQHQVQKDQVAENNLVPGSEESSVHETQQNELQRSGNQQEKLTQQLNAQPTSTPDQASNQMRRMKPTSIPFNVLIPILRPHLDKDRIMQLEAVFAKLRNNEINKENFLRVIKNIVGEPMLRQAVQKVQIQMSNRNSQVSASQHQLQASQQQASRGAQQFIEGQSIPQIHSLLSVQHQRGQTLPNAQQFVGGQSIPQTHLQRSRQSPPHQSQTTLSSSHIQTDTGIVRSNEVDSQSDSEGHHSARVSSTGMNVVKEEKDVSLVSIQVVNKQKQHLQHPSSSLSLHGGMLDNFNSHMFPRPPGTGSVDSRKSQTQDSQIRQLTPQGILSTQSGSTQPVNIMNTSKYEVQNTVTETNRYGGSVSHFAGHPSSQQSLVTWQSSASKDQKTSTLSTVSFVKEEAAEQIVDQQNRTQFLQGSFGTMHVDQGSPAPNSSKDETVEKQSSRNTLSASANTSMVMTNQTPGSVTTQLVSGMQIRSQTPHAAPPAAGGSTKTPPKKPSVGQKKPLETQGTPPPASKKQKVSGAYLDQSIEQLNDVTAVSGVNLREEEEQLLSNPKEESRASEATRRVVQEEEERLILQKGPLQKKLVEIMSKCGIKNNSTDVERCLSLSVEERLRGLISNLIRVSRQRVDVEKARHRIVFTSDVRHQILTLNKKAKEEWEKKQAEEAEKLRKQNECEGNAGADAEKEKDEGGRSKSLKATKEEDDKMRTTAANVAARAAVGGDDMLSKWQLMAEQARQKREGVLDTISDALPGRTTSRKPLSNFSKTSRENQEAENKGHSFPSADGRTRKFGRIMPHPKVARSISTKDVIAVLEREPQMAKTSLIYRLYDRMSSNSSTE